MVSLGLLRAVTIPIASLALTIPKRPGDRVVLDFLLAFSPVRVSSI